MRQKFWPPMGGLRDDSLEGGEVEVRAGKEQMVVYDGV